MRRGIDYAERLGLSIHFRKIGFTDVEPIQDRGRARRRA
jgi:hypothetical protein